MQHVEARTNGHDVNAAVDDVDGDMPRPSLVEKVPGIWLTQVPPPQEWLWSRLVPMRGVTGMLAEGGLGKSMLGLRLAEAVTHGSDRFMSSSQEPLALRQGGVCYITGEDPPEVIRRRLFAIRSRAIAGYTQTCGEDKKKLAKMINAGQSQVLDNFHIANAVGKDVHLVSTETGEVQQGEGLSWLIEDLRAIANLALIIIDPLARFHGGDENANVVATALVNAAEHLAQTFNCAVVVIHHVSKAAASDKNSSAHAGRGGSAFGDGCRSVLRLLPVEGKEIAGLKLLHQAVQVSQLDIDSGNVVRIVHAKSSYGPRQRDIYLLRDKETGELLTLKLVKDDRDPYMVKLASLRAWLADNPVVITKDKFRDATELRKVVFGSLSKTDWLAFFDTAVAKEDLVEDPDYKAKNANAKGYRLADTR